MGVWNKSWLSKIKYNNLKAYKCTSNFYCYLCFKKTKHKKGNIKYLNRPRIIIYKLNALLHTSSATKFTHSHSLAQPIKRKRKKKAYTKRRKKRFYMLVLIADDSETESYLLYASFFLPHTNSVCMRGCYVFEMRLRVPDTLHTKGMLAKLSVTN